MAKVKASSNVSPDPNSKHAIIDNRGYRGYSSVIGLGMVQNKGRKYAKSKKSGFAGLAQNEVDSVKILTVGTGVLGALAHFLPKSGSNKNLTR